MGSTGYGHLSVAIHILAAIAAARYGQHLVHPPEPGSECNRSIDARRFAYLVSLPPASHAGALRFSPAMRYAFASTGHTRERLSCKE